MAKKVINRDWVELFKTCSCCGRTRGDTLVNRPCLNPQLCSFDALPEAVPSVAPAAPPVSFVAQPDTVGLDSTRRVIQAIERWWAVRNQTGQETHTLQTFRTDLDHSLRGGLFRRLLEGKEPLALPPPTQMSRPWYSLVETGEGYDLSVWVRDQIGHPEYMPKPGDDVVVGQAGGWSLVSVQGFDDLIIEHPGVGRCRAVKVERDGSTIWKITVLK